MIISAHCYCYKAIRAVRMLGCNLESDRIRYNLIFKTLRKCYQIHSSKRIGEAGDKPGIDTWF